MGGPSYTEDNPPPELLDDIRRRWASVCADWPRPLFEQVTRRAAWLEFKYDRLMTDSFTTIGVRVTAFTLRDQPDREETAFGS
jgi:hypothetical protein